MKFECNCQACSSEADDTIDESLTDQSIPLGKRIERISNFLKQNKPNLFAYYLCELHAEVSSREDSGNLTEANQLLKMLFKKTTGHSPKLVIDVDCLITKRYFIAIGICCCNALKRGDRFAMDLSKEFKYIGRLLR